jgi:hypothetical protein
VLTELNRLGGKHGIGRLDLVENRYVGMKSRGCYETPGGTIMLRAHRAIESITLDREVAHLKDDLMPRYASLIYNGYWWAPERVALQTLIDHTQASVNGWVRVKLYKGNVIVVSRDSKTDSLFDMNIATFDEDGGAYNQADAGGFIKLNALRMRIAAKARAKRSKPSSKPLALKGSSGFFIYSCLRGNDGVVKKAAQKCGENKPCCPHSVTTQRPHRGAARRVAVAALVDRRDIFACRPRCTRSAAGRWRLMR